MQQPLVSIGRNPAGEDQLETHTDPVCKMLVTAETAAAKYDYNGETSYFCAIGCRDRFAADPQQFLSVPGAVATGFFPRMIFYSSQRHSNATASIRSHQQLSLKPKHDDYRLRL